MQRHDARVMAFMRFLDGVRPPGEHGVEHDQKANQQQPRTGNVEPQNVELVALQILHIAHGAEGHDQRAERTQRRPGARIDDVIVMLRLGVCVGHINPRVLESLFENA
jgi:hypothetical protein